LQASPIHTTMVRQFFVILPVAMALPVSFDAREQWPECVTPVRDSRDTAAGGCASEWAISATQTLQTNLCVMSKNAPVLSAEEIGSCNPKVTGLLCSNWVTSTAWYYIDHFGVRSEECLPYTAEALPQDECQACTNVSASDEIYTCPVASSKWSDDDGLKEAIIHGGAAQVTITMMPDLWDYTGGIHNPMPSAPERAELAIKLVGWGLEGQQFYWIAENTWGSSWGENGYFRVTNNAGSNFIFISDGYGCIQNSTISV